jgi:hypothetical protein
MQRSKLFSRAVALIFLQSSSAFAPIFSQRRRKRLMKANRSINE